MSVRAVYGLTGGYLLFSLIGFGYGLYTYYWNYRHRFSLFMYLYYRAVIGCIRLLGEIPMCLFLNWLNLSVRAVSCKTIGFVFSLVSSVALYFTGT